MNFCDIIKRLQKFRRIKLEMAAIKLLRDPSFGIKRNLIEEVPTDKMMLADRTNYGFFFVYQGPLDEKTRNFCRALLTLDKVFSEADITLLSQKSGYDVKEYEGSYNCRHMWRKFSGKFVTTPPPTDGQIDRIGSKSIFN